MKTKTMILGMLSAFATTTAIAAKHDCTKDVVLDGTTFTVQQIEAAEKNYHEVYKETRKVMCSYLAIENKSDSAKAKFIQNYSEGGQLLEWARQNKQK